MIDVLHVGTFGAVRERLFVSRTHNHWHTVCLTADTIEAIPSWFVWIHEASFAVVAVDRAHILYI